MVDEPQSRDVGEYLGQFESGTVLAVGDVPASVRRRLHGWALGSDPDGRRVAVVTDPAALADCLPEAARRDPDYLRTVVYGDGGAGPLGEDAVVEVPRDPGELGATVSEAVDAFEVLAGGLGPGDLRLVFDALPALVEDHGRTDVFGFLHLLTERLGRAEALALFTLPVAHDSGLAAMFAEPFDAVLELRVRDDRLEARRRDGSDDPEWTTVGRVEEVVDG